jgi:hypothetical protein
MVNSLIENAIEEINRVYQPETLRLLKRHRPEQWAEMLRLEEEINQVALNGDEPGLIGALEVYRFFIGRAIKMFKTPQRETGDLFHMNKVGSDGAASPG